MESIVSPSREDGVVRAASEVVGGPAGAHVGPGRHGPWSAAPVLVLAATSVMAVAVLLRQHCRSTAWASPDQFTHACYSDVPAVFVSSGMAAGAVPYLDAVGGSALQQPVGTGLLLWVLGLLSPGGSAQVRWVFDLSVLLIAASVLAVVVAVVRLSGRRPWDAALVALSPVLLSASLVSLDMVAVALAVLGVLAVSRQRPWVAGALVGAAVCVRPTASVVLLALGMLALRSGRWSGLRRTATAAAVVWALLNLPVVLADRRGWGAYWASLADQPIGYGSLWLVPQLAGRPLPAQAGRVLFVLGAVAVVLAVARFALSARRRPRLPVLVLLLVTGLLAVSPAVPVQASLWVLPFAALAVPRWRDLLVWSGVEVAFGTVTWLYIYGQSEPARGAPGWLYGLLLVARIAAWGWLARQAVSLSREPMLDPVRSPRDAPGLGRDDPAAGEIEGARDAVVVGAA